MPKTLDNSSWEKKFKDTHVDSNITDGREFVSSYRTVIYARNADGLESVSNSGSATSTGVTSATVSSNAGFTAVGVVQAYSWGENRQIDYIFELGSDIPYIVPGRTIGQIQLSRVMISGQDIINALYGEAQKNADGVNYTLNSLKDITIPFDLLFVAYSTNGDGNTKYSRVFKNCQIESRSESITAGTIVLSEGVSIRYENIVGITLPKK